MKFKNNFIKINGRNTFYLGRGQHQKEVIVMLHGFPGNHMGLEDMENGFKNNYRLIIPDMPACGQTQPLLKAHTLENYAKWLHSFLESLNIGQVIVVGHSFGSRVSLVFAAHYQDKVKKLVLITPVVKLNGFIPRVASLKGKIAKMLPRYMQKYWLSNRLYQYAVKMIIFKSASPKRRDQITITDIKESKNLDVRATIEIFDEFYKFDLTPVAKKVNTVCLIVGGDKDEVATITSLRELLGNMSNAKLEIMKNSGHLLPLERPKATARIIESWLKSN